MACSYISLPIHVCSCTCAHSCKTVPAVAMTAAYSTCGKMLYKLNYNHKRSCIRLFLMNSKASTCGYMYRYTCTFVHMFKRFATFSFLILTLP